MNTESTDVHSSQTRTAAWLATVFARQNPAWLARYVAFRRRIQQMTRSKRRWLLKRAAVSVTGAALLLALAQVPPAHAATITVDNSVVAVANDGQCSLPEAITNANNDSQLYVSAGECAAGSGADTITLSGGTYTLASDYGGFGYGDYNGLPVVTSKITIEGNGATIERDTITPAPGFRILAVNPSGDLTLDQTTVSGGEAYYGGGIYNRGGNVTLTGSTVSGNEAYYGGGIWNSGDATLTDSTVSGNSANYGGGGIRSLRGNFILTNSTISGNSAIDGAGIESLGGTVTLTDSTVSGNDASYGSGGRGGGIWTTGTVFTLTNSTVSGNSADIGGGIGAFSGTVTLTDSTVSGNTATEDAGGIWNDGADVTLAGSTVSGNSAVYDGGGILNNQGSTALTNSTVSGNVAGERGGGLRTYYGTVTLYNTTVTGNEADNGGGIHNRLASVTMGRSILSGNTVTNSYGTTTEAFLYGGLTSAGYNVLGESSTSEADALNGMTVDVTDIVASSDGTLPTALTDILDSTLQNNGGPTDTHALVPGSPAIDLGPTAACAAAPIDGVDQRGEPRSIDIPGTGNDGGANLCDAGAFEVQIPPPITACPVDPAAGAVGTELTTLLGTGMGSPTRSKMVAKVVIPNAADVTELYGQMAAKEYNGVRYVRFIFGDKSYQQVPTDGGTFDLGQTAAISWWGDDLTAQFQSQNRPFVKGRWFLQKGMRKMKLPRAIVFYPTHTTDTDYANAWSTFTSPDNFVAGTPGFPQTNSNILAIPETQATTDVVVQLAVTDVNRDARTVDVIVRAGGVEVTTTLTSPTNKKSELLDIFEVTLEDVPAGVDEVEIELVSVLDQGDSAALLGAAASYACELP